ncbi:hypothetical protein CQA53_02020 [Helicobacter didelphidarum]|uniref:Uncharacterized protein n=1 Tax=Helicobacter didelphidarum TaxID=2040648 RepID=A0A3D8IP90_9HELI|nr:hypothetical protein [Helicobacter didelphidarum]RDU67059.1 hypothetical protein CQA53_02020 [Helicobacter didelphidarum]
MSILEQFLSEYNEIYYKNLNKDISEDVFGEIRQVEKIMNSPKLHPTQELKGFYKSLHEQYEAPIRVALIGNTPLNKIIFINVLLKDSIIPLNNALAQKKFILKFSTTNSFARAYYKHTMIPINIHTFDCTQSNLDEIEYFEIFVASDILRHIEIIKDYDKLDKNSLSLVKDVDLVFWVLELKNKMNYHEILKKIIKKKPTFAILTHINKTFEDNELLELISLTAKNLDITYGLNEIYDIDLWNLFYEYRLNEKFMFLKTFGLLNKQITSMKTKSFDNAISWLKNAEASIESFYIQKEDSKQIPIRNDKTQGDKIQNLVENMDKASQVAKLKRAKILLKDASDKNKIIDSHYKILFNHYKSLDNAYHKANLKLIAKVAQIDNEYNHDVLKTIVKSIKKYLDSIVDSILDNVETIKVRTRPSKPNFFDILTNRLIVYQSFQVNRDGILRELEDTQSLLVRKHKNLITRINRFNTYIAQSVEEGLQNFSSVIEQWIKQGHHLVLQKKPPIISMDRYFSLEEFNLSVYTNFTKKHHEMMYAFVDEVQLKLLTITVWVQATKKILLEYVIQKLDKKFQDDKVLAKMMRAKEIRPLDRDFIVDCILEILPPECHELFCRLPQSQIQFQDIPMHLTNEAKENEKIIRYRVREIMDLRQTMKTATKLLDMAILNIQKQE